MKKSVIGLFVALAVAALAVAGVMAWHAWFDRKVPNFTDEMDLYVYPWMDADQVRDSILASGIVRSEGSLRRVFKDVESIEAGHYLIDSTCSSMYVSRMLHKGWQTPVNLTLSGSIRRPSDLARKIGSQMLADSATVASFIASEDSLRKYGVDRQQLFTMIIPDTYQFLWTASVREIFDRFAREKDAWWTPERLSAAKAQRLTPREVSVLASIVDGETKYVPEQPSIAAVYLNRLNSGMRLQADPTVAYCFDYRLNRILKSHLLVDSPYNTYQHAGLPPGPISCPPKTCLEAVLHPDSHNYIFFCADPAFNGTHRFASTYSEHLANARAFQTALTERQRGKK
ncbi:MAG: endolytic transglycosylase MltG [Bacteroidales bacterium]|nr:endolytic transglycosylase MltG [Bacteroidales bacterium]